MIFCYSCSSQMPHCGEMFIFARHKRSPAWTTNLNVYCLKKWKASSVIPFGRCKVNQYAITRLNFCGTLLRHSAGETYAGKIVTTARSRSIWTSKSCESSSSESSSDLPLLDSTSGLPCFFPATCLISKVNNLIQASHLFTKDPAKSEAGWFA